MILKKANIELDSSLKKELQIYVGILRGLYIIHQHAHLISQGKKAYSDHLLFQRLYEETEQHIDQAFEKIIGSFGKDCADLSCHIEKTYKFINYIERKNEDIALRSLIAEELFLSFSKKIYKNLEKANVLSFGIDDMIMSISSDHEDFVYLLKQRVDD